MGTGKDLYSQFETLYGKRDYTGLASLFASDGVYTDPSGRYEGGEAITAYIEQADKPFSDIRNEITGDRGRGHVRGRVDVAGHEHRTATHARRSRDRRHRQDGETSRSQYLHD